MLLLMPADEGRGHRTLLAHGLVHGPGGGYGTVASIATLANGPVCVSKELRATNNHSDGARKRAE